MKTLTLKLEFCGHENFRSSSLSSSLWSEALCVSAAAAPAMLATVILWKCRLFSIVFPSFVMDDTFFL